MRRSYSENAWRAQPTAVKHVPRPMLIPGEKHHIIPTALCSRTCSEQMGLILLHSPDKSIRPEPKMGWQLAIPHLLFSEARLAVLLVTNKTHCCQYGLLHFLLLYPHPCHVSKAAVSFLRSTGAVKIVLSFRREHSHSQGKGTNSFHHSLKRPGTPNKWEQALRAKKDHRTLLSKSP